MKLSGPYLDALKAEVTKLDTPEQRARYRAGDFPRSELVKDLDKRYRWDLFWVAGLSLNDAEVLLPEDVNDGHIDTALRRIVPPLGES